MPSEQQHRVREIIAAEIERVARLDDGWCWAWPSTVGFVHFPDGTTRFEGFLYVDRDRADAPRGRALSRALEERLRRDHPEIPEPLALAVVPTTRLDWALAVVSADFGGASYVDQHAMRGIELRAIERRIGWTPDADRVRVSMYCESSGDEERAEQLGLKWLEQLRRTFPDVASLVVVVGESH